MSRSFDSPDTPNPPDTPPRARQTALVLLKAAAAVGVLGFLFWGAQQNDVFDELLEQPKNWGLLAGSVMLWCGSVLVSFVRWYLIIRAVGLHVSLGEAIRVGSLGIALNVVGVGAVGGDVFKAIVIARGLPGRRALAVSTIVLDRLMGLLSKLAVATAAYLGLVAGSTQMSAVVRGAGNWTLLLAAIGFAGVAVLIGVPTAGHSWLAERVGRAPVAGPALGQLIESWSIYRRRGGLLVAAASLCLLIDAMLVGSFYCVARGLPLAAPPLLHHFMIVPVELTLGALPISLGGLGVREAVVEQLYQGFGVPAWQGGLISFGHSLVMLLVGGLAWLYYLFRRASVNAALTGPASTADPRE